MPLHRVVRLPDGRDAWIDSSEPIASNPLRGRKGAATRCLMAVADYRKPDPADLAQVAAWLDGHEEQSARCRAASGLNAPDCAHSTERRTMAHVDLQEALSALIVQVLHDEAPDKELSFLLSFEYPTDTLPSAQVAPPSVFVQLFNQNGVSTFRGQIYSWPLWPLQRSVMENVLRTLLGYLP